ncbi:MAG: putative mercuric transport protein [Acidobacteria bacterium]|nr:putative mercuric transport protein [Acidobacteriota bacterium]
MTLTFRVTGMTCGGCEKAVTRAVGQLDGVSEVAASHQDERVQVTFDETKVSREAIEAKINRLGYQVVQ